MQKITFKDYEKAIKAKYEIEKEGEYSKNFNPTAQANLRDLCWERFKENESKDDLSTFFSFFTFNFELNGETKKKLRDETDKFRTIASFYLKDDRKTVSRYAIELAAILVDFKPRPFRKFSEVGIILPEKPTGSPKVPFAFSSGNKEKEEEKNDVKKDSETINTPPKNSFLKWAFFFERLLKKSKRTILVVAIIFGLIGTGTASYFAFFYKGCMQWSKNHYEVVDKEGIEGNPNEIIQYDAHLLDFKKIPVCDTTTCFRPDGEAIVWYAKRGDEAEFFTSNGNGRHPETKKPLRPITEYIKGKYKGDCISK